MPRSKNPTKYDREFEHLLREPDFAFPKQFAHISEQHARAWIKTWYGYRDALKRTNSALLPTAMNTRMQQAGKLIIIKRQERVGYVPLIDAIEPDSFIPEIEVDEQGNIKPPSSELSREAPSSEASKAESVAADDTHAESISAMELLGFTGGAKREHEPK